MVGYTTSYTNGGKDVYLVKFYYKEESMMSDNSNDQNNINEFSVSYLNNQNKKYLISYSQQTPGRVKLSVYNILGQEVATILDDIVQIGNYDINWNGTDNNGNNLISGNYIIRLQTNECNKTKAVFIIN